MITIDDLRKKSKEGESSYITIGDIRGASPSLDTSSLQKRLETFSSNAEKYYKEAQRLTSDFETSYQGGQSASWYNNLFHWGKRFEAEADSIKKALGSYDPDTASKISDALDQTISQQKELLNRANKINNIWQDIGNEESWNAWRETVKKQNEVYPMIETDYVEMSEILDAYSKPYKYYPAEVNEYGQTIRESEVEDLRDVVSSVYGEDYVQRVLGLYGVTDKESAAKALAALDQDKVNAEYFYLGEKYQDEIAAVNPTPVDLLDRDDLFNINLFKIGYDQSFRNALLTLNSTEKGFVKYLASTGREDEIEDFVYSLEQQKNNAIANAMTDLITGIDNDAGRYLAELGLSVASGLSQAEEGIEGFGNLLSGKDTFTANNAFQLAGSQIIEYEANKYDWGKFAPAAVMLSAVQTTTNMLPSVLFGAVAGGGVGAAIMGIGAAGNAYNEAINSGMSTSSAQLYSAMIGASETCLQYLLGGITSLGKGATGAFEPLTQYVAGKVDHAIGKAAIALVGNGLSEATEEGLQEILDPWFKYIVSGGVNFESPKIDDVLYSSLLGFLSAGILEGVPNLVGTTINEINTARIGNAVKKNGLIGDVVEYVNTLPEEQKSKLLQNLTEDASGYQVGKALHELGAGLTAQNVQTIRGYLFELGLPEKQANTIAEGMAAVVNGEAASPELVAALDNPLVTSAWQSLFLQGEKATGQTVQTKDDFVNAIYRAVGVATPITEKVDTTLGDRVRSNINAYEDIMRRTSSVDAVRNAAKANAVVKSIQESPQESPAQEPSAEIAYPKNADEYIGRVIDTLGFDTLSAQVLKDGIKGTDINPFTYAEGVREAALIGLNGLKDDSAQAMLDNLSFAPLLPAHIRDMAYKIGRAKYDASADKADTAVREAVSRAKTKEMPKVEAKVTYDRSIDTKALNGSQKAQIAGVAQVARAIGVDVEFYDSTVYGRKTEKGRSNGFFTGNKLYLDVNAGTQQTILYTASHELTHFIKQWSPAKFETLKDFLFDFLTSEGYNAESFIKIEMDKAKAAGVKYSLADAIEDTVCEAMQMMLSSDNAIEKIAELSAKDKGLVDKIRKQLKKIIARITNALKGVDPTSESAKILQESYDAMQKLNTLFCEALVDAGENYSAVASAYGKDAVVEVNDDGEVLIVHGRTGTDAPIEHNLKTWKEGGRDRLAEYLSINGYSQNDIKRTLSVMDFYANAVYEYGNRYGLQKQINEVSVATDMKGEKTILSALIQNGDYPVNIDLTTICKKRQAMQKIVDRLCETGLIKSTVLNPETINQINKILGENALETACLGCFVESRRVNVQRWANEICNEWNKIVSGYNKKAPFFGFGDNTVRDMTDGELAKLTSELDKAHEEIGVNEEGILKMGTGSVARMEALLKNVPELRKFLRPGDLLTSDGRVNIKALPGGAELNSIILGRYGSNTPKVVQSYNPYTNELLDYNKRDFVQYLFDIGGARAQSFSDFMVENWFDYMQIVADAYARQIPMHMYTKESALVELFGMTGIKINMSLIPDIGPTVDKEHAGLTKVNGKWQMIWADKDRFKATGGKSYMQSFNYRDAVKLQNDPRYSKNIGTITIGISDAQIRMALGDDNIRMVIPYHLSGMNPLFARLAGVSKYNDYTPFQNNNIIAIYDENGNKVELKLSDSQKKNLKGGYEWNAKLQKIGDARATAQDYIAWCRDRNNHTVEIGGKTYYAEIAPKFSGWDNNGKYAEAKDFTNERNYYKLLEDFNSYYFEDGKEIAAPQGAVQMNFPDNFQKVLEGYLSSRQSSMDKMGDRLDKAYKQIESYIKDEDFSRREKMLDMLDAKGKTKLLKGKGRAMSIDEQVLEQNLLEKQFGLEQTELTKEKTRDLYSPERVAADGEGGVKHSLKVTDEQTIERLDNDKHFTTYKSFVQIDGKLYSPMATKVDSKLGNPYELGQWYQAEERPDFDKLYVKEGKNYVVASKRGFNESNIGDTALYYKLQKDDGSTIYARYNPYEHSSNSVFNDQFSSAYKRPGLVTVEMEVPASEQGAYKAKYAKDGTGWTEWKSGKVSTELKKVGRSRDLFLSRYAKPVRVIPNAEVAKMMAKELKGTDITVSERVVPPALYEELKKAGVKTEDIKYSLPSTESQEKNQKNIRHSFKGETAQGRKDNLDVAKQMAESGIENEKIRLATGWFKGMDGKWRYEINDSGAKLIYKETTAELVKDYEQEIGKVLEKRKKYDPSSEEYTDMTSRLGRLAELVSNLKNKALLNLGDFLDHKELYEEYPALKLRQVKFDDLPRGTWGQTDGNSITLSNELKGDDTKIIDTLLHEIQHIIQGYEGFAQGSNSAWWEVRLPRNFIDSEYLNNLYRNDSKYQEMLAGRKRFVEQLADADVNEKRLAATVFSEDSEKVAARFLDLVNQGVTEFDEPFTVFRDGRDAQNAGLLKVYAEAIANELDMRRYRRELEQKARSEENSKRIQKAFDLYKNTKGEIEARDVSNRRTLTAEQRRQLPPDIYNPNAVDVENYDSSALKYSLKSAEELSDRYYLSSALESATVNENEKNILKEYQSKIDQADALQEKLDKLNADIHKYMFQKGRDTERLKSMQNNAKTLGDKLSQIDKSLLKLERMSVLKDLATREKNKAVAKERARQKQYQSEMRENYKVKDVKRKIQKIVKDLNKLLNGTKDRNIKIPLQETARKALTLAEQMFASTNRLDILYNLEGEGLEDYKAIYEEYEALESKITDEGRAIRSRLVEMSHEFDDRIDEEVNKINEARTQSARTAVNELANAYRSLQENENGYAKQAWDEGVQQYLDNLVTDMSDVSVDKLTFAQLDEIYKAFRMVYHTISVSNKLFKTSRSVSELSKSVIDQVGEGKEFKLKVTQGRFNALNWIRTYSWNNLKPIYAFERIGSDDLTSLFWNVRSGEDVWARDIQEANIQAVLIREKYGWRNWDMNQRFDVQLQNGNVFPTTLGHLLSIVAYARREQALAHMAVGGFTYRESDLAKVGKWSNNKAGAQIKEEDLKAIVKLLTKEQINYAYEMQDYLSKIGEKGNEVSKKLYGINLFGEDYYLPIKSSRESITGQDTERNNAPSVASLKNKGFTKNVTPNAKNKMELVQLDELWASHVNEMALYHGMVLPLTDLNKVVDFKESGNEEQGELSVKSAINQKYGTVATDYLAGFIRDVNGGVTADRTANLFTQGLTKFKKTATMMSLSVIAQQYTSVARAAALMNPKYFTGKTDGMSHKQAYEELMQYAPIAFIKQLGGFDTGSGRTAVEYLMDGSGQTKTQRAMSKIDEVGGFGAQYMDEIGWITIWNAVKRELRDTTELTGEEFLKKCGERFTEIIVYTQVYDSTLTRSAFMRSKNPYMQMLTAFMGEPTTSMNMLYNAILQRARGKWTTGRTARTIGATYTSMVLAAAAASLVYAMRDDDDEEKSFAEIYGEKFGAKLRDELAPWNSLPFIRDVASLLEGWDVTREDVSIYGDFFDDLKKLFEEPNAETVIDFAGSFGNFFGIPASNVIRDTKGLWNLIKRVFDGVAPHDFFEGLGRGITGNKQNKSERLLDVMRDQDQNGLKIMREEYSSDEDFVKAQKMALRDNVVEVRQAAYKTVIGSSRNDLIDKVVSLGYDRNLVEAATQAEADYIIDKAKDAAKAFDKDKDEYKKIVTNFKERYKDVFGSESKAQDFIVAQMNRVRG